MKLIKWIIFNQDDGHPEWTRTLGLTEDGQIFLPAVSQKHEDVFLDIIGDDVAEGENGHNYFPIEFMYRIYPYHKCQLDELVRDLKNDGHFDFSGLKAWGTPQ